MVIDYENLGLGSKKNEKRRVRGSCCRERKKELIKREKRGVVLYKVGP